METIKHECGIAIVRLLKPLEHYKNKYGTNKLIEGIICSVEHEINKDNESFDYKLNIKVY